MASFLSIATEKVSALKSISLKRVGPIVSIRFFDRMVDRQTRQLSAMLGRSIAEAGGYVRLLLAIETDIYGRSPESLFESLQFVKLHADQIDRIAIVGRKSWERTCIGLFGLFSGITMEYFDRANAVNAVRWLQGLAPQPAKAVKSVKGPSGN